MVEEKQSAKEDFASLNGMSITAAKSGWATAEMTISERHLNEAGIPHGGVYFALADTVFGAATDYVNEKLVTIHGSIDFFASAKLGDTLTATSREVGSSKRLNDHDVGIRDSDGSLLAIVHLKGYRIQKD